MMLVLLNFKWKADYRPAPNLIKTRRVYVAWAH